MKKQIKKLLSALLWIDIPVQDNFEPLVELRQNNKLRLGLIRKPYVASVKVRKTVADKLYQAAQLLPQGYGLVVIEGFRSLQHQQESWIEVHTKVTELYKDSKTAEEIEKIVNRFVARPSEKANHITGGAIDVTVVKFDGTKYILLDMGTPYISEVRDIEMMKKFPMFAEGLTPAQVLNRTLLRTTMEQVGFVWYPGEWWHFCFWDRMWAGYTNELKCFYGPAGL